MSVEFLGQMGWKSALICGAALLLLILLRSRSAADRAAVLRVAVLLLLMLPVISVAMPRIQIESAAIAPTVATPVATVEIPAEVAMAAEMPALPMAGAQDMAAEEPSLLDQPELLIGGIYALGVLLLSMRLLAGLITLRRWTASAEPARAPTWLQALLRTSGEESHPRLLVSDHVPAPMSWGWRNPVILIDRETYARSGDADAILAHEMAHVTRGDWTALMLSRLTVALFWFNPLVWLLERQAVRQAEEAADCAAALFVEPTQYAQTLVSCARRACGKAVPANSIAPSPNDLAVRVKAILDGSFRNRRSNSRWTFAAMGACVLFAVPVAAAELVAPKMAPALPPAPPAPFAPPAPPAARAAPASLAPVAPAEVAVLVEAPLPPSMPSAPAAVAAPADAPAPAIAAVAVQAVPAPMPIRNAPPAPPATPDTPAPPPAPRGLVDADTLVSMRIHGATPEYAAEMARAVGRARLQADELVAMRIHGVSPRYVRELAEAGYRNLTPNQLVAMRIQGVSVGAARRANRDGPRLTPEELIERAIHGDEND